MTRDEHIQWCKTRALFELDNAREMHSALISIMSDLKKHPETENHSGIPLTIMLMASGNLKTREEIKKHIEGFN